MEEKRSTVGVLGGHNPPGRARLVPTRGRFLEVSLFRIFLNIPKLIKIFLRIFWSLLTYRITYLLIFMILECSGRTLLCVLPVSKFG